jgi:hypothetical protein
VPAAHIQRIELRKCLRHQALQHAAGQGAREVDDALGVDLPDDTILVLPVR